MYAYQRHCGFVFIPQPISIRTRQLKSQTYYSGQAIYHSEASPGIAARAEKRVINLELNIKSNMLYMKEFHWLA